MKFDNNELPNDLLENVIQNFFTTKALVRLSGVCKNWHVLINSDPIWKKRLQQIGLVNSDIEKLREAYQISNNKDLYLFLTGEKSLNKLLINERYKLEGEWRRVAIDNGFIPHLNSQLIVMFEKNHLPERENYFLRDVVRLKPLFFNSLCQYLSSGVLGEETWQPKKFEFDPKIEKNQENIQQIFKEFCDDATLYTALQVLNQNELLFATSSLHHLGGGDLLPMITGAGQSSFMIGKFIRHHDKILFILEIAKYLFFYDDLVNIDIEDSQEKNFKEKIIFEIDKNGCTIVGHDLLVDNKLLPIFNDIFDDCISKITYQYSRGQNLHNCQNFLHLQKMKTIEKAPLIFNQVKHIIYTKDLSADSIEQVKYSLDKLIRLNISDAFLYKLRLLKKIVFFSNDELFKEYEWMIKAGARLNSCITITTAILRLIEFASKEFKINKIFNTKMKQWLLSWIDYYLDYISRPAKQPIVHQQGIIKLIAILRDKSIPSVLISAETQNVIIDRCQKKLVELKKTNTKEDDLTLEELEFLAFEFSSTTYLEHEVPIRIQGDSANDQLIEQDLLILRYKIRSLYSDLKNKNITIKDLRLLRDLDANIQALSNSNNLTEESLLKLLISYENAFHSEEVNTLVYDFLSDSTTIRNSSFIKFTTPN